MNTTVLDISDQSISYAVEIWCKGGLVAFPTETVYGLGADATNGKAVAKIYEAKTRPQFNPLIIHVANLEAAQNIGIFNGLALKLAHKFWPGPMTLVVPIKPDAGLSSLVTAGLDTVGIRIPNSAFTRQLLEAIDIPIAAPSANPSGLVSPTHAAHVLEGLSGRIDAVIDGGPTKVGLESTILKIENGHVIGLRAGGIAFEEIAKYVPLQQGAQNNQQPTSPGQLASHYAPNTKMIINVLVADKDAVSIGLGEGIYDFNLSSTNNLHEAASNLFHMMRQADKLAIKKGLGKITITPIPSRGLGVAINDRIMRAATPTS